MAKQRDEPERPSDLGTNKEPGDHPLSALDRLIQQAIGDGRALGADDDPAEQKYPNVWRWMSQCYVMRDRVRTPSPLTIKLTPTGVVATLTDRDLASSCTVACQHLSQVLDALEETLAGPNPLIVSWGRKEPQLRKRQPRS